jgi:hypothetical protein
MIKVEWKDKFLFCAIIYSVGELILWKQQATQEFGLDFGTN